MSDQTITAVFQDGVFQPTMPGEVTLREGQKVKLSFEEINEETEAERSARVERILSLLNNFYEGLSQEEIDEIEDAMRRRPNFFGDGADGGAQFESDRTP